MGARVLAFFLQKWYTKVMFYVHGTGLIANATKGGCLSGL